MPEHHTVLGGGGGGGVLGNLLYPLSVQTVAAPKLTKISLLPKERCDDTFPTQSTPHSLLRGGACAGVRV